MKKYINAELQIVRVTNDVIATSNISMGPNMSTGTADAPSRRRSIWD